MRHKLYLAGVAAILLAQMVFSGYSAQSVSAQTTGGSWSEPINLSNSGSTRDPGLIVDNDGTYHVVWQDDHAGTVYSQYIDGAWSNPRALKFPFEFFTPRFVKDERGGILAAWLDIDQSLHVSYVNSAQFDQVGSWSAQLTLAESVLSFDITIDSNGKLHLVYLRTETDETYDAGIYYRSATNIGSTWVNPVQLYASSYLRSLESGTGHVQIATAKAGDTDLVYAVWDNRSLKRIFLAKSADGGEFMGTTPDHRRTVESGPNFGSIQNRNTCQRRSGGFDLGFGITE